MMRNIKIKTVIIVTICVGLVSSFSIVNLAQQTTEEGIRVMKSYLFNASSASYKLEATANGRGFQFCNTSKKRLKHIQLGCVKSKKDELFILSEREFEKWDNDPISDETEICEFWVGHHGFFPVDECKKGKLALTEVAFEDGTIWHLKQ